MLDVLSGEKTGLTELAMVKRKPFSIPPEPIAYPAIQLTRAAVARSDERNDHDGPLLKLRVHFASVSTPERPSSDGVTVADMIHDGSG